MYVVVPVLMAKLLPRLLLGAINIKPEDQGIKNEYKTMETCQMTGRVTDISDG